MGHRITILAYGSRGDIQPFLALALGLTQDGFLVRLAAPEVFRSLIEGLGIPFASLPGNPSVLVRALVREAGWNPVNLLRVVTRYALPLGVAVMNAARAACTDADLIIHSFLLTIAGHEIARELLIPDLSGQLFPFLPPTRSFPALSFPAVPLGGRYNRFTHRLTTGAYWQANRLAYAWVRRGNASLPPLSGWPFRPGYPHRPGVLLAISPALLPRPADWDDHTHLTGYWFLPPDESWVPPESLVEFLDSGPPPLYIGFGSMINRFGPGWNQIFVEALQATGQRALIAAGSGGFDGIEPSNHIYPLEETPHEWLFPQVTAAVHHGGAGTTGAALRAGIPNVIIPFIADQPFWGHRVQQVGAGPEPLPAKRVTVPKLITRLDQVLNDPEIRQSAQLIGSKVKAEEGVRTAVKIIETYF